jgi:hypothetical protein
MLSHLVKMHLQCGSVKKPRFRPGGSFPGRPKRGLILVSLVFFLANVMVPRTADGQGNSVDEYKLKAAMLYNLIAFVEWPDMAYSDRQAPTLLCILGKDPFESSLTSTATQETANGRIVLVRQLQNDKDLRSCQVLYISSSERKTTERIFSSLNGSSVLTVGEMNQFAAHGGIVQFSLEEQRVRFNINVDAASKAGLKISSKLLAMAQIVKN